MDHTHQNPQKVQSERKLQKSPKNGPAASKTGGQVEKKTKMLSVISFIEGTMRTLSNYGERLKNQLDINLIQKEMLLI